MSERLLKSSALLMPVISGTDRKRSLYDQIETKNMDVKTKKLKKEKSTSSKHSVNYFLRFKVYIIDGKYIILKNTS